MIFNLEKEKSLLYQCVGKLQSILKQAVDQKVNK